jgi:serine/threonine-protein kinase HipA
LTDRTLEVYCFGARAGTLTDAAGGLAFDYETEWLSAERPPLSQSLPLSGGFGSVQIVAFFGGLLPEGRPRELLARQLGVSVTNDFGLLEQLGGDTAGAVSVQLPGSPALPSTGNDVEWLDDAQLAELIDELPQRPMHADPDGEYRLSLAGAQDKLPVVVSADGRVGLTKGRAPSTHILKTPIDRLPDTVANEAFCLALGRRLGIATVSTSPTRVLGRECLLVERYDRRQGRDGAERLHQEDFCQALGIPADRKYEAEGGPTLADCFALIRRAAEVPAREAIKLLDYVGFSFLVGNHDAHGKNYSLLYLPDSADAIVAPAYDVLSTIVYEKVRPMSRKMAMKMGGEYRPAYVRARHLDRMFDSAGLGVAAARRRLGGLARSGPKAAADTHRALAADGWDSEVLARIEAIVAERARWLEADTAPQRAASRSV